MRKFGLSLIGVVGLVAPLLSGPAYAAPIDALGSATLSLKTTAPAGVVAVTPGPNITAGLTSKTEGPMLLGAVAPNLNTSSGATGFVTGASVNGGANLVVPYTNGPMANIDITIGTITFRFNQANTIGPLVAQTATATGSFALQLTGFLMTDTSGTFNTGVTKTVSLSESCSQSPGATSNLIACSNTLALPAVPVQTPEPASLVLLGSALVGLGLIRRRRRTA